MRKIINVQFEKKKIPLSLVVPKTEETDYDKKKLKVRSAYFALNGAPEFSVREVGHSKFVLLAGEEEFFAVKMAGITEIGVSVYAFNEKQAEIFTLIERLKNEKLSAIEQANIMQTLVKNHRFTQQDIAEVLGKSRPAVANTMRLLGLHEEVLGLIKSGKLSAGHARTLVKVPKEKQTAFAQEAIKRKLSVRDMERAVRTFLIPPEVLRGQKEAKTIATGEELKGLVERMRKTLKTQVSLIGNEKKGRLYIDYYTPDDLRRISEILGVVAKPDSQISIFEEEE